ncbi:uncharacterized protein LOC104581959 [Brachypodium distachyon]|uniref:uncharacterized protein LOC104581959 n=1 Tax=Brachypodium distachyon TaxID=15368 RepID=UPI00071DBF48|nr:uncharacterized protein LOC104581959 [Brachypodium distachyon]|eukprot:XP_014753931.1 uncharacterized protein LOC104581959 [Brachypodium distachyon]
MSFEQFRDWMYNGWDESGRHSQEWIRNTNEFVNHAFDGVRSAKYGIRCTCAKCCNDIRRTKTLMTSHLCQWGFMPNYYRWTSHGEQPRSEPLNHNTDPANTLEEMLCDFGDSMHVDNDDNVEAEPTPDAKAFYAMLAAVQDPLHNVTKVSRFRAVTELMGIRSVFNLSGECINRILNLVGGILPEGHTLPSSLYDCKSLLSGLKMPYIKIDACINHCMLYYKEDEKKVVCDFCKEPRYIEVPSDVTQRKRKPIPRVVFRYLPLIPRLQRLFMEPEIAKHMRWHMEGMRENANIMVHPADSESWKGLNEDGFADDPRNMRLVMCTDGFNPFSFGATTYSCWPVFVAPLNLPPGLKRKTYFLAW